MDSQPPHLSDSFLYNNNNLVSTISDSDIEILPNNIRAPASIDSTCTCIWFHSALLSSNSLLTVVDSSEEQIGINSPGSSDDVRITLADSPLVTGDHVVNISREIDLLVI